MTTASYRTAHYNLCLTKDNQLYETACDTKTQVHVGQVTGFYRQNLIYDQIYDQIYVTIERDGKAETILYSGDGYLGKAIVAGKIDHVLVRNDSDHHYGMMARIGNIVFCDSQVMRLDDLKQITTDQVWEFLDEFVWLNGRPADDFDQFHQLITGLSVQESLKQKWISQLEDDSMLDWIDTLVKNKVIKMEKWAGGDL